MRRQGKSRGARGAWVAALVAIVLIAGAAAARMGGQGTAPQGAAAASATAAEAGAGGGQGTSAAAGGSGAATASAGAGAAGTATATATGGASAETGGPLAVARQYFADLSAGQYQAAYDLLAPSWQAGHTLASFVSGLPAQAPILNSASMGSVANFDATVQVTLQPAAGGSPIIDNVQLVDVNQAATGSVTSRWLVKAPPAGAGG